MVSNGLGETLWQDIRYGLRMLRKSPGFTAIAALTLTLGIGANATIFSIVNTVLLRPLPFKDSSRLMMLGEDIPRLGFPIMGFSAPDLAVYEHAQKSFAEIGVFQDEQFDISGQGEPERVRATRVSASVFPMLGVRPILGRLFTPQEDAIGHNVVLLSYGLWRGPYGGDLGIVGRTIELDRQAYTIVGVMPRNFEFPLPGLEYNHESADLWVPIGFTPAELQGWGELYTNSVLARLRPGVTLPQASAEAESLSHAILANYPPVLIKAFHGAQLNVSVNSFRAEASGSVRTLLLVLMATVALVLLIACSNVATLLLSRAASRQKEIAIRMALGATRSRLVQQMLTEGFLLALAGGLMGLLLAFWGKNLLLSLVPRDVPFPHSISIGAGVLAFVLAISCLTVVLFALVPAFHASAMSRLGSLEKWEGRGTPGRDRHRLQGIFVVAEFAVALVLLVGAGLLIRSFNKLLNTNLGFRPDHVLTINLPLPSEAYPHAVQVRQFYEQLLDRVRGLPGVKSASLASDLPLQSRGAIAIQIEGGSGSNSNTPEAIAQTWVLPSYFQVMGIPLLRGRSFTPADRADSQPVAMVSQSMARKFWPDEDPLGMRIRWGLYGPWQTIVGIVGDVNDKSLGQAVQAHVYTPYLQAADFLFGNSSFGAVRSMSLCVHTKLDPATLTSAVVGQVHSLDPDLAVADIYTMRQVINSSIAGHKFSAFLLGVFAGVALFLAAIGIYGVLSYTVAQRSHEIGIRLALGAKPGDVLRLVLRRGLCLAGLGAAIGVVAAVALTRSMASLLYGVSAMDPVTFAGAVILLVSVALLACYVPARRAMRVDPIVALRYE